MSKGKLNYYYKLEKDSFEIQEYELLITQNGWQYIQVFRGCLGDCKILVKAYKDIGYKRKYKKEIK